MRGQSLKYMVSLLVATLFISACGQEDLRLGSETVNGDGFTWVDQTSTKPGGKGGQRLVAATLSVVNRDRLVSTITTSLSSEREGAFEIEEVFAKVRCERADGRVVYSALQPDSWQDLEDGYLYSFSQGIEEIRASLWEDQKPATVQDQQSQCILVNINFGQRLRYRAEGSVYLMMELVRGVWEERLTEIAVAGAGFTRFEIQQIDATSRF